MEKMHSRSKQIPMPLLLTVTDEINVCCQNIATVAALLESCGEAKRRGELPSETVIGAGQMIRADVRRLRVQFDRLTK